VDVTDHVETGMHALRAHKVYFDNLEGAAGRAETEEMIRSLAAEAGAAVGVPYAVSFECI
jgi:LmbE family N-acetylglucosaminyl deacetylase